MIKHQMLIYKVNFVNKTGATNSKRILNQKTVTLVVPSMKHLLS